MTDRPMLALALRLGAMVMLSVMLLLVKLSGLHGIALAETMFWRQLIPALLIAGWLGARGQLQRLRTQRVLIHARRAAIGTAGMVCTLGVVQLLPLAEATVLGFTTPIFAVVFAATMLGERVGPWRWGAVALGLGGVLVIALPGIASHGAAPAAHTSLSPVGIAVGIIAAFMVALVSIQLRELGQTEEPLTVVFYFSALSAPVLALALPWFAHAHDRAGWLMLIGIGVIGLFAQLLMTAALRFGRVASVVVMDYSQLGWATMWGWLVFSQLPPTSTWSGAPLVIAAGCVIAWREQVRARRLAAASAAETA